MGVSFDEMTKWTNALLNGRHVWVMPTRGRRKSRIFQR
jgi:hypothetical protein